MTLGLGQQISDRLKAILPKYTDDFSNIVGITSLNRASSTVTAISTAAHGLVTGGYVMIRGAKEPITLTSITREGEVVTVVSSTSHKLTDPLKYGPQYRAALTVEISGAVDAAYNGVFQLLTVPDDNTFTYKITTEPVSPASTAGFLLLPDFDGYNGYKQVTVIDTTTFTYETAGTGLQTPAQGVIEMSLAARIQYAANSRRVLEFYSSDSGGVLDTWMFVVVGPKVNYNEGTVANDVTASKNRNSSFWYLGMQEFSIYVVVPSTNEVLGGEAADQALLYEKPILKAIVNFIFQSNLFEGTYQPVSYVGADEDDYIKAYYTHRFDFQVKGLIQNEDVAEINPGVPFQLVDGTILDTGMEIKPNLRD
jgi:hypothetical protein